MQTNGVRLDEREADISRIRSFANQHGMASTCGYFLEVSSDSGVRMHNVQRFCESIDGLQTESLESATEERSTEAWSVLVRNIRFVYLVHTLNIKLKMIAHVDQRELRSIRLGKRDSQLVIDRLNDDYGVENRLQVGRPKSVTNFGMLI